MRGHFSRCDYEFPIRSVLPIVHTSVQVHRKRSPTLRHRHRTVEVLNGKHQWATLNVGALPILLPEFCCQWPCKFDWQILHAIAADVQAVIEAEDRTTLRLFNDQVIKDVGGKPFDHVMLVDGNDERGIDVGLMTRAKYPILSIRSHVDDTDAKGTIFSRDCAEYEIGLPKGKRLWVLVNHLKSKGYGSQASNDAKRKRQAQRVRALYDAHLEAGDNLVAVVGDLNEIPGNRPMDPLLRQGSTLKDNSSHPAFVSGGKAGTHGNCGPSAKLDYILLSPDLFAKVTSAGVERRGMWGGVNGTLWPHFKEVSNADEAASDHAALWVDLDI